MIVFNVECIIGDLTTCLMFTITVIGQVMNLSFSFSTTIAAVGATSRVFSLLDSEPVMKDGSFADTSKMKGMIQLTDVKFTYPSSPEEPVLKGISFSVAEVCITTLMSSDRIYAPVRRLVNLCNDTQSWQGTTAALVGPSGGGKSTIMALLQRFYDPNEGSISIDGSDIRTFKVQSLRKMLSIVAQEPVIFAANLVFIKCKSETR